MPLEEKNLAAIASRSQVATGYDVPYNMISILLPSVRPHLIRRALDSIPEAAGTIAYEIIVIADFVLDGPPIKHCTWLTRERRGVVDALNAGMAHAQGEYVFSFNDESVLDRNALQFLYDEAEDDEVRILTPQHLPIFNFSYYGISFAPFPFVQCELLEALGGIADPAFRAFYADPDLSLRAHAQGIPVQVVEDAIIRHCNDHDQPHHENVSTYLTADRAAFRVRWDHLGEFRDP